MSNNDWGFERLAQPSRPQEDVRNMPYTTPFTPQPTKVLRDERLERIATAAMVAWIPFTDLLSSRGLTAAQAAMNDARDLIAELDKQA